MSLARNPNMMAYSVAGRQAQPQERLKVKSSVHVPNAEIGESFDGRMSYSAPDNVYCRKRSFDVSAHTAVLLIGVTLFVMMMLVISTLVKKQAIVSTCNDIVNNMYAVQAEIDQVMPSVMEARNSATICYKAAQQLGMVASQGVEAIEIIAPDTRPTADSSLSAGVVIASVTR